MTGNWKELGLESGEEGIDIGILEDGIEGWTGEFGFLYTSRFGTHIDMLHAV